MSISPTYTLTVYEEDDETVLFEVSTDPAHQAPFLKAFDNFPEQEVDFVQGSASIGQMNVRIVDVPYDPLDQDTGYLTGLLSSPGGGSQIMGHRVVAAQDVGSGPETILDGVVHSVQLTDTFASYELELRDIRERERKAKAFQTTDTPTVLPRGVLGGYGIPVRILAGTTRRPVPPTSPLTATYLSGGANGGLIDFHDFFNPQAAERTLTAPMREALESIRPLEADPDTYVYDRWKLLWRAAGTGTYTTVEQIAHSGTGGILRGKPYSEEHGRIVHLVINNDVSGAALPSDQQEIEVIVQYDGPVTEEWPLHLQDLTVGVLLRNLYRGDHSDEDPRIRYDEDALLALTTPIRAIIKEPIDDLRAWAEKHAYPIAHAVPSLNAQGEISPVTYLLPDATVTVPTLSDSNLRPAGGGWSHGSADAVNVVRTTYHRDYRVPPGGREGLALSDQIRTVPVNAIVRDDALESSVALIGEQPLEIDSLLLRAIGHSGGGPMVGEAIDETGSKVAARVGRMALDRLALGGQYFAVEGRRTDSDIEGLKVGDYVIVAPSWHPDYSTGERGANRLAQVLGRRNLDPAWTSLTLIDAGAANVPLAQPTLGTVTVDANGAVSAPVTSLADGAYAWVDFAVNPTEPPAGSELWTLLGVVTHITASGQTVVRSPPTPPGSTVWVRARSQAVGRRPSAYTTPVSVTSATAPRIVDAQLTVDELAIPTIAWITNDQVLGIRLHYEVHDDDVVPTLTTTVDVDVDDGSHVFTGLRVPRGKAITVRVEPWTGWTGSAVSGSAGIAVDHREDGEVLPEQPWVQADFDRDAESETATLTLTVFDFRGSVSAVEHSKREGSQAGDLFGAWVSTWDTAPSTPPFDGTYSESLVVPGGEESSIKWRVTFTDKDGASRTVGGTHSTAMVDEHETKIVMAGVTFRPEQSSDADNYQTQNGYLTKNTTDATAVIYVSSVVPIPAGVLITAVEQESYIEDSLGDDEVTTKLYAWDSTGSTIVGINTHNSVNGWAVTVDDVSHTVDAAKWYNFDCLLDIDGADPVSHARLGSVAITYTRHTQQENL